MNNAHWEHGDILVLDDETYPCENPFPEEKTMAKKKTTREFTCTCRKCGKQVPMGGIGPRDHLARCRPEVARAIDAEYRGRIRALAGPAEEGLRGAA